MPSSPRTRRRALLLSGSANLMTRGHLSIRYAEHVGLVELNGVAIGPTTNAYCAPPLAHKPLVSARTTRTLPSLVSPRTDETMMAGVTQGMRELVAICERANCTGPNPQRRPEDAFDALVQVC